MIILASFYFLRPKPMKEYGEAGLFYVSFNRLALMAKDPILLGRRDGLN